MAETPFPRRAFIQAFDGQIPPDYAPVAEELKSRDVEVITRSSEEVRASPLPLEVTDLVIGDFQWTKSSLAQLGIEMPTPPDYPECLKHLLHRKIWQSTLGEVKTYLETVDDNKQVFIKPAADTKAFSAIIEPKDQMIGMLLEGLPGVVEKLPADLPVHCAEVVQMISEYRVYVVNGEIRSVCHYQGPNDGALDMSVVEGAVATLSESEEGRDLTGCGMDFAVLKKIQDDGEEALVTALVEVNDGYSLGVYDGLSGKDNTDLLIARWGRLTGQL